MTSLGALPGHGVLAVHAHPDDETLTQGGTLALWARSGQPVTVVTCTRGERGEVIPPPMAHLEGDGAALGARREWELAAALGQLGVRRHYFLDQIPPPKGLSAAEGGEPDSGEPQARRFEDSGMRWVSRGVAGPAADASLNAFTAVPLDVAAAPLADLIRAEQPWLVLTYEPGGGYGHPDHIRAREVALRAVKLAAEATWLSDQRAPWRTPLLLGSVFPADELRAGRTELVAAATAHEHPPWVGAPGRQLRIEQVRAPMPAAAREDRAGLLAMDVSAPHLVEARIAALRAHVTQIQGVVALPRFQQICGAYALSDDVVRPLLQREYYEPDPQWPPLATPSNNSLQPATA